MTITAFIRVINNKTFLLCAVIVFLIPFVVFCFWNFPSIDDYIIIAKREKYSFLELQSHFYTTWSGRYFATFLSTVFSYSGFLYAHYYVHTLILFLLTVLSWLFCLIQVNKLLFSERLSFATLVIVSLLLLVFQINIVPEPVTAFYWFSSAITYQVPLILLVLFIGMLAKFYLDQSKNTLVLVVAAVLLILINGCNEVITLFALAASTGTVIFYYYNFRSIPPYALLLYGVNLTSACFLLFGPGILNRASHHDHISLLSAIIIGFTKFVVLNWYFLKEPIWWFSLFLVCLHLKRTSFVKRLLYQYKSIPSAYLFLFYVLSGLFIYIPILYVANGSIPLRSENIICFLYSIMLMGIVSVLIVKKTDETLAGGSIVYSYRYLLVSILIFSTPNMKRVTDTLLSGFLYKQIMEERLGLFANAKRNKQEEVTYYDYKTAVLKKIKEQYPLLNRQILRDVIVKPPPILFFENDQFDLEYIKEFHGVRKVNVLKN